MDHVAQVLWGGFVIGLIFGAVGQVSGFCLTSGFKGAWRGNDSRRLRSFALALAVAILGAQTLDALGLTQLSRSIYPQASFSPILFGLGGMLFGYGMVMANGCGSRSLVLLGSGNLRAFVVLVCLGIAGHVTLTGLLAGVRVDLAARTAVTMAVSPPTLPGMLASLGPSPALARWLIAGLLAAALIGWALRSPAFRATPREWLGGIAIGALIPAAWYVTGHLGADDFDPVPVVSLTFIAPVGDTIQYAMLATGVPLGFGVAVVTGVLVGALVVAVPRGAFRLEGFTTPGRMLRSMGGGLAMGIGGALCLGCSIGQGLSGLSTLAAGSFVAAGGIMLGGLLALRGPLRLPLL